jgi:nitroreductase
MTYVSGRQAEFRADPLFVDRWSARAYTGEEIPDDILFALFEAARWAPSASNSQPWRFLYAKKSSPDFDLYLSLLFERNRLWAKNAGALVVLVSKTTLLRPGSSEPTPARFHTFDAGAAWANLALQASLLGWSTRAIGGFDHETARKELNVPDDFAVEIAIAIGRPGEKTLLPEEFQALESPNQRRPIAESIIGARFPG